MQSSNALGLVAIAAALILGLFVLSLASQALDTVKPQSADLDAALFSARQ